MAVIPQFSTYYISSVVSNLFAKIPTVDLVDDDKLTEYCTRAPVIKKGSYNYALVIGHCEKNGRSYHSNYAEYFLAYQGSKIFWVDFEGFLNEVNAKNPNNVTDPISVYKLLRYDGQSLGLATNLPKIGDRLTLFNEQKYISFSVTVSEVSPLLLKLHNSTKNPVCHGYSNSVLVNQNNEVSGLAYSLDNKTIINERCSLDFYAVPVFFSQFEDLIKPPPWKP